MDDTRHPAAVAPAVAARRSLVGRGPQLSLLTAAVGSAATGTPRVVVVTAEPGLGKTALLDAFTDAEQPTDVHWLRVSCDAFEQDVPFGALSMVLDELPDAEASPIAVATQLLRVVGAAQAGVGALVVIFDDVQWMDLQSGAALRFAVRRLRADRVVTVIARRPTIDTDPWASLLSDTRLTTHVRLAPLSVAEIAALARAERSWELAEDVAARVGRHTGGVPLLVQTFLLGVTEAEVSRSGVDLPVPSSSAAAVTKILHTLDDDARQLLRALAVLDEPTPPILLASVAGVESSTGALAAALGTLLVTLDSTESLPLVRFAHDLLRVAVYDGMRPGVRRELHERAAQQTTGTRSLGHRVAAADRPDPGLAQTLVSAAAEDAHEGRDRQAASRLLQARAVTSDPAHADELLLRALAYHVRAADLVGAAALRRAAEGCPPSALRSHALGLLLRDTDHMSEAEDLLTDAISRADAEGDTATAEAVSVDLASLYATLNRGPETIQAAARGCASSDPSVARTASWHLALGRWYTGDLSAARAALARVPPAALAKSSDADALSVRGALRLGAGDLVGAEEDFDATVSLATSRGSLETLNRVFGQRCNVRFLRGDWDGAAVDASNACAMADAGDIPWYGPIAHSVAAVVPANRGQWDEAAEQLSIATAGLARLGSVPIIGTTRAAVYLAAAREDSDAVWRAAEPLMNQVLARSTRVHQPPRWLFSAAVYALVRLGRLDEAAQTLGHYERLGAVAGEGVGLTQFGWLHGLLAEARGAADEAAAAYARDLSDPTIEAVPFARAQLLHSAGKLERALGNRREAIDRLRSARDIFVQLRAAPYVERCDSDLAAAGLPQQEQSPLALTLREQDVATLVSRGLTNAEAAAELFVTPKTVEYHLSNVYAKLGISSRRALRVLIPA